MPIFQVQDNHGQPINAHFKLDGSEVILLSRGGAKSGEAKNTQYSEALRLILERIFGAGMMVALAVVDSNRVQSRSVSDRTIFDLSDHGLSATEAVKLMSSRMKAVGRNPSAKGGNSTKQIRIKLLPALPPDQVVEALKGVPVNLDVRSRERIPVDELEKVKPAHIWWAVGKLVEGNIAHPYGDSTDYDVILPGEIRLSPKAVFGIAASEALGFEVLPKHFYGGKDSPCFRLLLAAGLTIVQKSAEVLTSPQGSKYLAPVGRVAEENEGFPEGMVTYRLHQQRERDPGLVKLAKKRRLNEGKALRCEVCDFDFHAVYGAIGEGYIEAHHARPISEMKPGDVTRPSDLVLVCSNCHRMLHRKRPWLSVDEIKSLLVAVNN